MGLFNRKKKEEVAFNYDEMMKKAKLFNLLKGSRISFIKKISTNSGDVMEQYKSTYDETNYVGIYDKNNKLLLAFEIDLDKLNLYQYLVDYTYFTEISKKVDIQPISNIEFNKEFLSNYLIKDFLTCCSYHSRFSFYDDTTVDYVKTAIRMYINNYYEQKLLIEKKGLQTQ